MKTLLVLVTISLHFIGAGTASADGPDFELLCPASTVAGSTFSVSVTQIENWDCSQSYNLKRSMITMIANPNDPGTGLGNNLGGLGIYGPFIRTGPDRIVPAASCSEYWAPGTYPNFGIGGLQAPNTPGKAVMVVVAFITPRGKDIAGDMCLVNITP